MRCAVGPQKESIAATGRRFDEGLAVLFTFQNRQAIVMGANATREDRVAVVQQVMRRDGGSRLRASAFDILCRFLGGDVLKHNFEFGKIPTQRDELAVDENGLSVK